MATGRADYTTKADVNITNATLDVDATGSAIDANITNASIDVAQSGTWNVDASGSTIDANITNASIDVSQTGAWNVGITGTPTFNIGASNDVNIASTTGDLNCNITNATIPVTGDINANITNATLDVSGSDVTISSGSIDANITNATISVDGDVNINGVTVNVGRLPALTSYDAAFNLTKDDTPIIKQETPADESDDTRDTWIDIVTWDSVDAADYNSNLSTSTTFEVSFTGEAYGTATGGYVKWRIVEDANELDSVQINFEDRADGDYTLSGTISTTGVHTYKFQKYVTNDYFTVDTKAINARFYLNYTKSQLLTADFGMSSVYLKSVKLSQDEAVKLNDDSEQILTNSSSTAKTLAYENPVLFTQLDFLNGTPSINVLGNE